MRLLFFGILVPSILLAGGPKPSLCDRAVSLLWIGMPAEIRAGYVMRNLEGMKPQGIASVAWHKLSKKQTQAFFDRMIKMENPELLIHFFAQPKVKAKHVIQLLNMLNPDQVKEIESAFRTVFSDDPRRPLISAKLLSAIEQYQSKHLDSSDQYYSEGTIGHEMYLARLDRFSRKHASNLARVNALLYDLGPESAFDGLKAYPPKLWWTYARGKRSEVHFEYQPNEFGSLSPSGTRVPGRSFVVFRMRSKPTGKMVDAAIERKGLFQDAPRQTMEDVEEDLLESWKQRAPESTPVALAWRPDMGVGVAYATRRNHVYEEIQEVLESLNQKHGLSLEVLVAGDLYLPSEKLQEWMAERDDWSRWDDLREHPFVQQAQKSIAEKQGWRIEGYPGDTTYMTTTTPYSAKALFDSLFSARFTELRNSQGDW